MPLRQFSRLNLGLNSDFNKKTSALESHVKEKNIGHLLRLYHQLMSLDYLKVKDIVIKSLTLRIMAFILHM